jgi:tRNA threonylcarbamoyladenosine biosynthesis protein TsaE
MDRKERITTSREEMLALGKEFGGSLKAGDLIVLKGELGAGKTTFTQGIGLALGLSDVSSPTFVISRIHKSKPPLVHVDAYRLLDMKKGALEFDDLDLDTNRDDAIIVIEWGSDLAARLAESYFLVEIEMLSTDGETLGEEARKVVISKR